jgi:hypothetical protein
LTPETDAETISHEKDGAILKRDWVDADVCRKFERERNELRDWIMQAAPMLSTASRIVIDEAVERLGEIEGCRAVLELCPVDFINPENSVLTQPDIV